MAPDPLPAYLRLHLTLEPVPAGVPVDAAPDPFPAPAVRGMLGKALVDRFCPFGHPHCDPKGPALTSMKRPSSASAGVGGQAPNTAHRPERARRAAGPALSNVEGSAGADATRPKRPPTPAELCHLAETCPYGVLYASSRTRRPPYALHVPAADDSGREGRASAPRDPDRGGGPGGPAEGAPKGGAAGPEPVGDHAGAAAVELTLYGPACRHYPWVLQALADALWGRADRAGGADRMNRMEGGGRTAGEDRAGRAEGPDRPDRAERGGGPGRPRPGGPHRGAGGGWRIAAVARVCPDRSLERLSGSDLRELPAGLAPDLLGLHPEPFLAPAPVTVELLSPTHLLLRGKPVLRDRPVPFELLVKSTLDRFAGLYGAEASPVLSKEIRSVVEARAAEVPLLDQDVRPAERSHHSQRSRARLDLGGTVGRLTYGPPAAAFAHILQAAEVLHIGKNPTFGCGRVRVELETAPE